MTSRTLSISIGIALTIFAGEAMADGKQAFVDANCSQCHSVTSEGIEAMMMGLELDGVGSKRDASEIAAYLRQGAPHPMPWAGSDENLVAIADWLATK